MPAAAAVLYKQALDAGSKPATKTITKHGAGLADRVRFKKGGVPRDRETPPQYRGPCCGGTREVGMGNKSRCICCGKHEWYVCQDCRRPLALTDEQRERASMVKVPTVVECHPMAHGCPLGRRQRPLAPGTP